MKRLQYLALVLCLFGLGVTTAAAQKRTTHKTTGAKSTTPAPTVPPLEVRAARQHVDIQLSDVNSYLAKLGPAAENLETGIVDQKAGRLRPQYSQLVDDARANFVRTLQGILAGLTNLESEFRTKPALAKYLPTIQGITDLASKAEDSAVAGQFVAAKDPLRDVVKKLTDTLNSMPNAGI